MSLISPSNLLAPFQNKVHLIALFLIAVAFLVLRLSGGTVSLEDKKGAPRVKAVASEAATREEMPVVHKPADAAPQPAPELDFNPRKEMQRLGLETIQQKNVATTPARPSAREDILEDMLKKNEVKKPAPPVPAAPGKKQGGGLDEIEESLGLR